MSRRLVIYLVLLKYAGVVEIGNFVGADGNIIGVLSGLGGVANNSFSLDFV